MVVNSKIYNLKRDGVTQGLLEKFQSCREKARLFLEGWSTKTESAAPVQGNLGHAVLEQAYEAIRVGKVKGVHTSQDVKKITSKIEQQWELEHPRPSKFQTETKEMAFAIVEATLPVYFDYWKKDLTKFKWEHVENSFCMPIKTSVGAVPVRGKMDGVYKNPRVWLFETKFKSLINEEDLVDVLPIDKQVNTYLLVLARTLKVSPAGVLYNVVRRTSLKLKKGETLQAFMRRLVEDIKKRPDFYFMRYEIAVTKSDLDTFEKELQAMVQDFVDWYEGKSGHYRCSQSCITKYGRCEYLNVCSSQNYAMLAKRKKVFRELEDY